MALCVVKLNGNRSLTGTLRGYDQFMNLVLDETVEHVSPTERNDIGMVVRCIDETYRTNEHGLPRSKNERYSHDCPWCIVLRCCAAVTICTSCCQMIRGNSVVMLEALESL